MEYNINSINDFSKKIDAMLNLFYEKISESISLQENRNSSVEITRVIRRNFEESYHQFNTQVKRMVESILEQSKMQNESVSFGTVDFSAEVDRILNDVLLKSHQSLIPGNFKESMNFDILRHSFDILKGPLGERMNNDY